MVDLKILQAQGITREFLRGRLSSDDGQRTGTPEERAAVDTLKARIRSRVQEGINRNLTNWQWIYALDKAWDTPFRQFHPKLFADMDSGKMESCCSILSAMNLGDLVETYKDASGKDCHRVNEDKFTLLVGLVRSYTTIRWAKIVNDRRLTPFLKFEPAKVTTINRTKCEVLTDRVQVMATQYGYFEVMKQSVLKMLHYGRCIKFIQEEWHSEEQLRYATTRDVESKKPKAGSVTEENPQGTPCAAGDVVEYIEREGLRYDIPHESRVYRDLAHPLYTINTDSGCNYGGYWKVVRYGEVARGNYWNKDRVSLGTTNLVDNNSLYFQNVYTACTMKYATAATPNAGTEAGVGTGTLDREKQLADQFYGSVHEDQGCLLTHHFEKIVPSECGLGPYSYPVWFRFVLAGDQHTILYAAPLPSSPMTYMGYDADESRSKNASLAMEILPYQYQFENLLTQIIQSCKQNLANLTLINKDVLDEAQVKAISTIGQGYWQKLNLFSASFKSLAKLLMSSRGTTQDLGVSLGLPKANIAELVNVLKVILDVLERVLVMSSHEVAQAASHEQTREEVRNIAQSTSSRLTFTATPVDLERDAWKRQIYAYLMTYGDDDFYGHIPAENEVTKEQLTAMGFTYVDNDAMTGKEKFRRVLVNKSSVALPLYEFASTRDGEDRTSDREVATVMATFARDILNNPMLATAIGPDQALAMANQIAYLAGLPRDFKLRNIGATPEAMQAKAQEDLKQVVDIVLKQTDAQMQQAITPLLEEVKRQGTEIAVLMRIAGIAPQPNAPNQSSSPAPGGG